MQITTKVLAKAGLTPRYIKIRDEESAEKWLKTLAVSEISYHIDDSAKDVFSGESNALRYLDMCVNLCFHHLGNEKAWDIYYEFCKK